MNEILNFLSEIFPLIEEEFDPLDPNKIGPKTSKYILENSNCENRKEQIQECDR